MGLIAVMLLSCLLYMVFLCRKRRRRGTLVTIWYQRSYERRMREQLASASTLAEWATKTGPLQDEAVREGLCFFGAYDQVAEHGVALVEAEAARIDSWQSMPSLVMAAQTINAKGSGYSERLFAALADARVRLEGMPGSQADCEQFQNQHPGCWHLLQVLEPATTMQQGCILAGSG